MSKSGKIYGLLNPRTNKIFYVGCTQGTLKKRLTSHITTAKLMLKTSPTTIYINKLLHEGVRPEIQVLEIVRTPNENHISLNSAERFWINQLIKEGVELVNKNNVLAA